MACFVQPDLNLQTAKKATVVKVILRVKFFDLLDPQVIVRLYYSKEVNLFFFFLSGDTFVTFHFLSLKYFSFFLHFSQCYLKPYPFGSFCQN